MDRCQRDLLRRIQELEFVAIDLNLFLDTHPDNRAALRDYSRVVDELKKLKMAYEHKYDLLTVESHAAGKYPWNWIEAPWPWEIEY
ncbi:spore coat protein CotJB [Heliobacillus mobilis]|uniref:Spore coat protein CotJB n=2 Tax=Heliobacterium TaxID=2697 RepID=A0A6I3SHS6_HELMO|nr:MULTISPECIES: spore coat protein CotJB [Heliobacterium]MBC9785367.1 spore coat protein CotJB [Heliobacterium chlorum]MTV48355.1 spore coat protein CotJB [Heliobacterium mobile]